MFQPESRPGESSGPLPLAAPEHGVPALVSNGEDTKEIPLDTIDHGVRIALERGKPRGVPGRCTDLGVSHHEGQHTL